MGSYDLIIKEDKVSRDRIHLTASLHISEGCITLAEITLHSSSGSSRVNRESSYAKANQAKILCIASVNAAAQ
jgi:hypothetical protein